MNDIEWQRFKRLADGCSQTVFGIPLGEIVARVDKASREAEHWKSNHRAMVDRCALLREREDLPVDRIPAYRRLVEFQSLMETTLERIEAIRTQEGSTTWLEVKERLREIKASLVDALSAGPKIVAPPVKRSPLDDIMGDLTLRDVLPPAVQKTPELVEEVAHAILPEMFEKQKVFRIESVSVAALQNGARQMASQALDAILEFQQLPVATCAEVLRNIISIAGPDEAMPRVALGSIKMAAEQLLGYLEDAGFIPQQLDNASVEEVSAQ